MPKKAASSSKSVPAAAASSGSSPTLDAPTVSLSDVEALELSCADQLADPAFGKQGHLKSTEDASHATLYAALKIPVELGDMACESTMTAVAFKNAGKSDLKIDLGPNNEAVAAFLAKAADVAKAALESAEV